MWWCNPLTVLLFLSAAVAPPATLPAQPADGRLPHLHVDVKNKRVGMECEAINPDAPLEFLACVAGTVEHESILRSRVRPSHLHLALLMIGLEPGEPMRYVEKENRWLPPRGPALKVSCQFRKEGREVTVPAYQLMRNRKTGRPMPAVQWVFTGSRPTEQAQYAADITGYLISVVNFEHTPIDIGELRSNANELLEWELNPAEAPPRDAKVWLIIEPASRAEKGPARQPAQR